MKRKKKKYNEYILTRGESSVYIRTTEDLEKCDDFDDEYKQRVLKSFEHLRRSLKEADREEGYYETTV